MIQKFVDRFMMEKPVLRSQFEENFPDDYATLVKAVISAIATDDYGDPDPGNIHVIDDGDYQGTQLFIIPENTYQPDDYWFVKVAYGSCSGCDALEALEDDFRRWSWETDEEHAIKQRKAIDGVMTLALHIVQAIKPLEGEVI